MRGVAAVMVMWFHFTFALPDGVLRASGLYGYLGVEVFFVISGFIIPYSMDRPYRFAKDGLAFIGRRILRLEPPYLMSVLLILCVPYIVCFTLWFDGDISVHDLAIGYGLDRLIERFAALPPTLELALRIAATLVCASLFWWLIERPSTRLSKGIRGRARPASARPALAGLGPHGAAPIALTAQS